MIKLLAFNENIIYYVPYVCLSVEPRRVELFPYQVKLWDHRIFKLEGTLDTT